MRQRSNIFDVRRQTGNFFSGGSGGPLNNPAFLFSNQGGPYNNTGVIDLTGTTAANQVKVSQLLVFDPIVIAKVIMLVQTVSATAGSKTGVGMYLPNITSAPLFNAIFPTGLGDPAAAALTFTLPTPVLLSVGAYFFAWSCQHVDTRYLQYSAFGISMQNLTNKNVSRVGTAANAAAAGVLPATLGVIAGANPGCLTSLMEAL